MAKETGDGRLLEAGDLAAALALLTRLPVPAHAPRGARAAWAWPLAGALVGLLSAAVGALALTAGLGAGPAAALAIGAGALLTGGLHEDGLADCADGFSGGGSPERRLAVMRDSRIGAHGALALLLVTLLRWQALAGLLAAGGTWGPLVAAGALSRWPMAAILWALPPVRRDGLSRLVGRPSGPTLALGGAAALLAALAAAGWAGLGGALAALGVAGLWGAWARARIGGQTGDVCGAAQQLSEAAALLVLLALRSA